MNAKIVNINEIDFDNITITEHPCMPNLAHIQEETWCVIDNKKLCALCSLWTENTPPFEDYKTGVIGNFFAEGADTGVSLLRHASERLQELGVNYAIGPMNGNSWHSYRLVTHVGEDPPFFMEYFTPKAWPQMFISAGFKEIASYSSARAVAVDYEDSSAQKFKIKKEKLGLIVRPFNVDKLEAELRAIHTLSVQSFSQNFLYTDISLTDFSALYEKIVPYIAPDYFLMAEHQGKLVGFIFAVPNYLQKQQGETVDSVIIKTIAKIPDRAYAGLGSYLFHEIHKKAAANGFRSVIHAYMYDSNQSKAISDKSAQTMRKYGLYGKRLIS